MKIITENGAYIQKNDVIYLKHTNLPILKTIFLKVLGEEKEISDKNRFDFVKLENDEEIEYLKNLDWIIDYNQVKNLKEKELIELGKEINDRRNILANKYNSMSNEERMKNNDLRQQCQLLEFKMFTLRDIILLKKGYLKFKLPIKEKRNIKNVFSIFQRSFGKKRIKNID